MSRINQFDQNFLVLRQCIVILVKFLENPNYHELIQFGGIFLSLIFQRVLVHWYHLTITYLTINGEYYWCIRTHNLLKIRTKYLIDNDSVLSTLVLLYKTVARK